MTQSDYLWLLIRSITVSRTAPLRPGPGALSGPQARAPLPSSKPSSPRTHCLLPSSYCSKLTSSFKPTHRHVSVHIGHAEFRDSPLVKTRSDKMEDAKRNTNQVGERCGRVHCYELSPLRRPHLRPYYVSASFTPQGMRTHLYGTCDPSHVPTSARLIQCVLPMPYTDSKNVTTVCTLGLYIRLGTW